VESIAHPWKDLDRYIEARIKEALYEFELTEEFLSKVSLGMRLVRPLRVGEQPWRS